MNPRHPAGVRAVLITALCLAVLACILTAGLWPFHVERNGVGWLNDRSGLRFAGHGAAASAGSFRSFRQPGATGFTLELGLTPARTDGHGTFLAFDSSADARCPFKLSQFGAGLAVQRYSVDSQSRVHQFWFKVPDVFEADQPVFVTVTSGANRTDLYLNGVLAGTSTDPGIASRELTGRLVIGDSTFDDSWKGDVTGVAIYAEELTSDEVSRHFQRWSVNRELSSNGLSSNDQTSKDQPLVALYRFNERSGKTVHNQADSATDLTIPARYSVLHHAFLNQDLYPQTQGTWSRLSSWIDLAVNIFGFTPVGFVFLAFFTEVKPIRHAAFKVVLIGFLLSLTIEVSQWFLPNRDSGMADLVTNTTGTAIGVLFYRYSPLRPLWNAILQFVTFEKSYALKASGHSSVSEENKELTLSR
jgi:VanZ family protein